MYFCFQNQIILCKKLFVQRQTNTTTNQIKISCRPIKQKFINKLIIFQNNQTTKIVSQFLIQILQIPNIILLFKMKPSVRPPSAKITTSSKNLHPPGILNSQKQIPSNKPLQSKLQQKNQLKSIKKIPSYGELKSNPKIGSKQLPKSNKTSINNPLNPQSKIQKPYQPPSTIKTVAGSKPSTSSIQKTNIPFQVQKPSYRQQIEKPKLSEVPVKKSVGPTSRFQQAVQQNLQACKECGRTFNEKALIRHQKICKKVFTQKRKQFNSAKQRLISKQQTALSKKNKLVNKQPQKQLVKMSENIPKWKQESLAFRAAMKNARGATLSENEAHQFHNQPSQQLVPCKFCGKKFSQQAHTKHVIFCQKKSKQMMMLKKRR